MKIVIQRVKKASVKVDKKIVGEIDEGMVVLLGVGKGDTVKDAQTLVDKITHMRIFVKNESKLEQSLLDIGGEVLVVPQFTLYADTSKGRRPYFGQAAKPEVAKSLFEKFVELVKNKGVKVEKGKFGAKMEVELVNDGPVTIILDSENLS